MEHVGIVQSNDWNHIIPVIVTVGINGKMVMNLIQGCIKINGQLAWIESPLFCRDLHHWKEHKKIVGCVKFEVPTRYLSRVMNFLRNLFSLPMILKIALIISFTKVVKSITEKQWSKHYWRVDSRQQRDNNTKITRLLYFENYSSSHAIFTLLFMLNNNRKK
jgi:hypothetical protein